MTETHVGFNEEKPLLYFLPCHLTCERLIPPTYEFRPLDLLVLIRLNFKSKSLSSGHPCVPQLYKDWRPSVIIQPTQQDILQSLAILCELAPEVRFGQLIANLGFLAEDLTERTLGDIEDAELLQVIEQHKADLCKRQLHDASQGSLLK